MVEPTIEFKEEFKFENLKSDFLLSVEVFGFHAISNTLDSIPKTPKQAKKLGIFQSIRHNLTPKVIGSIYMALDDFDFRHGACRIAIP